MVDGKSFGLGAVAGVIADRVFFKPKEKIVEVSNQVGYHAKRHFNNVVNFAKPRIANPGLYFPKFKGRQ